MRPVRYNEDNLVLQPGEHYKEIPAAVHRGRTGEIVTCWEFSEKDIERLKETKRLFITQFTNLEEYHAIQLALEYPPHLESGDGSGI